MDIFANFFHVFDAGVGHVFTPASLLYIALGTLVGLAFGALPGLSSTMALAIFTPLTFGLLPSEAIVFLIAVFISSVYAGDLTSILVNIPGTPSSIATGFDGYPMTKKGEAGRAIGVSTVASVLGGAIGLVFLIGFSPFLVGLASYFGTWEFALLGMFALTMIALINESTMLRGLIGGVLGLLIACVGADVMTAYPRLAFNSDDLAGGIDMIVFMVGLFGFSEIFSQLEESERPAIKQKIGKIFSSVGSVLRCGKALTQSSLLGVGIGVLPGAGASVATIAAYGLSKRTSKHPEEYGKGSVEGLTAATSAANASVGGALVPMMTLGIPGDPMTAVLIGALMIHGLAPGPSLFTKAPEIVSGIYLGYMVALVFMLIFGLLLARPFARLIALPRYLVLPAIMVLCILGAYSIQNSIFDVGIAVTAGFVGYLLKKVGIYPAPIILGVVLGPMIETNFRRAIMLGDGDYSLFFTRPLSLALIVAIVLAIVAPPLIKRARAGLKGHSAKIASA